MKPKKKLLVTVLTLTALVVIGAVSFWLDFSVKQAFRTSPVWASIYDPPPPGSPPPPDSSPPPGGGYCGDGDCAGGESPSTCSQDCGPALCENPCGTVCCDGDICRSGMGCWANPSPVPGSPAPGGCTSSSQCSCSCPAGFDCAGVHCVNNGCYSDCTDSPDAGDPDPVCYNTNPDGPTLNSPTEGAYVFNNDLGGGLTGYTLSWNGIADANWGTNCTGNNNNYAVYIGYYESPAPATQICWVGQETTSCNVDDGGGRGWLFEPGRRYYWRVEASNGERVQSSVTWSFLMGGGISGTVYEDSEILQCSETTPASSGWTVSCDGVAATPGVNGNFTCVDASGEDALTSGPHTVSLSPSGGWLLSCDPRNGSVDLQSPPGGTPNVPDYSIMITQAREAWFQTQGGDLHADSSGGGVTVQSEIPDTCTAGQGCTAELSLVGGSGQPGVVSRASGTQELGIGETSANNWQAQAGSYEGVRADYAFWLQHLSDVLEDWDGVGNPGEGFWLASGDATIGADWGVVDGEQLVLLVPGNVTINADQTVAEGGSLLIVASGTISFDPAVTQAQGIYVADTINTGTTDSSNDSRFFGEGTFVGWSGITLARVLQGVGNATLPAELFTYRPDIVYNLPTEVKRPLYTWREVP